MKPWSSIYDRRAGALSLQRTCLVMSIVLHVGLLGAAARISLGLATPAPVMVDLTFSTSPAVEIPGRRQHERPVSVRQQLTPHETAPRVMSPSQPVMPAAVERPVTPVIPQSAPLPQVVGIHKPAAAVPSLVPSTPASSLPLQKAAVVSPESARQQYLKEHFTYLRDLISRQLVYPMSARRMGLSGRVVVSFIVSESGTIHSVQIKTGSGFTVLDNAAVETIRNLGTVPRPPVAAEIVMPVGFRLQ